MNKTKTIVSIISIILVLAMIAGLIGYLSGGFKNWNVKDWFAKENTEKPDDNKGNDKTEIKERSVAFDLKFDTLDEANGYYTATLTKDQKAALLDYPNTYFFAEITGEYNGEEQAKAKIPMFFFTMYDTTEGSMGIGFSDTGSSECNVAFVLPVLGNDNTGKFEAIAMSEMAVNFTLTFPEDSVPMGKALMDYVSESNKKSGAPYSDLVSDVDTSTLKAVTTFSFTNDDYNDTYDCYYKRVYTDSQAACLSVESAIEKCRYIGVNDKLLYLISCFGGFSDDVEHLGDRHIYHDGIHDSISRAIYNSEDFRKRAKNSTDREAYYSMYRIVAPGGGFRFRLSTHYYEIFMSEPGTLTFYSKA